MAIQDCERCGNLYHKTIKDICPKCVQQEEEDYKKVRMYLKRNKTVEMLTVSEETGVDIELIYQFLQEGRIVLSNNAGTGYPCKQCGTAIQTGSLCTDCTDKLSEIKKTLQTSDTASSTSSTHLSQKAAFHAR